MAWLTQADLLALMEPERLTQCADDDGDGVADAGVVAAALALAEARVTDALGAAGYSVGASPARSVLDLGAQAARIILHERRPASFDREQMDYWTRRYDDALSDFIDGTRVLSGAEREVGGAVRQATSSTSGF